MVILVFGTGAVGGYLGGRLAAAGHTVTFLARPAWADPLRRRGLRIEGGAPAEIVPTPRVLTDLPATGDLGPPDVVLLTVKAYDVESAAAALAGAAVSAPVVSLLNGVGAEAPLEHVLGPERVIPATLTTAVSVPEPGTVRVERARGVGLPAAAAADPIAAALAAAGIAVRRYPDALAMKWSKLPTNIVANASSAILGWTAARTMADAGLRRLEIEAIREAIRVMHRLGHRPVDLPGVPVRLLAAAVFLPAGLVGPFLARTVARGRGDKLPSFHHDIGRRRSEVGWLNGAVVAAGETVGVPTPANRLLLEVLLALVHGRDAAAAWRHRTDRLLSAAAGAGVPGL